MTESFVHLRESRGFHLDRQFFAAVFVQQHILSANGHHGESMAMRVYIVIKVGNDGLITRITSTSTPPRWRHL